MGRRRTSLPELGEDESPQVPQSPKPPSVVPLTEDNWQELKEKFEEGILAGLGKDDAGAYAFMRTNDVITLVAREIDANPNWLIDLETVGKSNLRATARVIAARKVRAGDASFVLPVVQATSPDLSPKVDHLGAMSPRINNPINILLLPDVSRAVRELDEAVKRSIIDVTPHEKPLQAKE
jgi:hypothetical protein